jgi:tetratricopeptide (TPR) repeat protein
MPNSSKIQNLRHFTVQIRHLQTDAIVGTGFVVSSDGLIVTCTHVVVAAGISPRFGVIPSRWEAIRQNFFPNTASPTEPTAFLTVYCPTARRKEEKTQRARIVGCCQDSDDDVVLLKLETDDLPEGVEVALVESAEDSVNVADDRRFRSYGYRRLGNYQGLGADGKIVGTIEAPENQNLLKDPLQLRSPEVDSGMSGAAVLDTVRDRVVGIIAETSDIRAGSDRDTCFAVDYAVVKLLREMMSASATASATEVTATAVSSAKVNKSSSISPSLPTVKPVALPPEPAPQRPIDMSRAPALVEEWVGRESYLAALNQDWVSPGCHVTGVIGFGGEGKSSLARHWIQQLQQDSDLPKPDGIFWWGFYEQPNVTEFLNAALAYLDLKDINPRQLTSVQAKSETIRAMRGRYLFVLDGLEDLQEEDGDDYGLLKNPDLRTFLRTFADGNHASFCLLTSRFPVLDLIDYTTYRHRGLDSLSIPDGCQLLKNIGVKGTNQQLAEVVEDWGGYALSLRWVGTYLLDKHRGNVKRVGEIPVPNSNEPVYDRLQKVLQSYDRYITQAEQEFLKVFSLLRLPATDTFLRKVFDENQSGASLPPPKPSPDLLTKLLRRLKKLRDWLLGRKQSALVRLRDKLEVPVAELNYKNFSGMIQRLIAYRIIQDYCENKSLALHPLIRIHYLGQLRQESSERIKAIHRQIGAVYQNVLPLENPSLNDLAPLIEAVHHLCQAGEYNEAYEVLWNQVFQKSRRVLTNMLGAWDISLNMIREFFPDGDIAQKPLVSRQGRQAWILNHAGLCLKTLGQLEEAFPLYERSNEIDIAIKNWSNVSTGYHNIALLYADMGNLVATAAAAESSLTYARRFKQTEEELDSLKLQGWVAHLLGEIEPAHAAFQSAEYLARQLHQNQHLTGGSGVSYATHLIRRGDSAYARRIVEAALLRFEKNNYKGLSSSYHRLLGHLEADTNSSNAQYHYNTSVQIARSTSDRGTLIEALLGRGRWLARRGESKAAGDDLEEALGYAIAGSYRLHEADIRIGLAWMHHALGNLEAAQKEATKAQQMSESMGYYWGQKDAAEALEAIQ